MFELTEEALQVLINLFVKNITEQIETRQFPYGNPARGVGDKIASGMLYDSIQGEVEIGTDGEPYAVLYYADYFPYVNRGRKKEVRRVPLSALLNWIKIRGIKGRNNKGRFITDRSLAFGIQTNIFKYGIRPTNIYDRGLDAIEDYFDDFPNNLPPEMRAVGEQLFEAVAQDINNFIDKTLEAELK